jgi:hypothetical protein
MLKNNASKAIPIIGPSTGAISNRPKEFQSAIMENDGYIIMLFNSSEGAASVPLPVIDFQSPILKAYLRI